MQLLRKQADPGNISTNLSMPTGGLPLTIFIIRLKLKNLQEDDVDFRNLSRDLQDFQKGPKPIVQVFDIDSKAPDSIVDDLVNKISK